MYSRIVLMGLLCILDRGIQICCDLLSTLLDVADPISLDVLVSTLMLRLGAVQKSADTFEKLKTNGKSTGPYQLFDMDI